MSQKINLIIKQALATFKNVDKTVLNSNLEKLKTLVNGLSASDVGLQEIIHRPSKFMQPPATYIDIYECELFTVAIFIIHKGMSIPLHDHPGMLGICKALYGKLKITSYDHVLNDGVDGNAMMKGMKGIQVNRQPTVILTANDNCNVLQPYIGNFHAIHAVDEDAAMFDILAPPYSAKNDCHYYRETASKDGTPGRESGTYLVEVPQPVDFYCNTVPYSGPTIVPP